MGKKSAGSIRLGVAGICMQARSSLGLEARVLLQLSEPVNKLEAVPRGWHGWQLAAGQYGPTMAPPETAPHLALARHFLHNLARVYGLVV